MHSDPPASAPPALPDRVGPYRIVSLLGKGGMGAVCEAVHETIGRRVAIKVLHARYAHDPDAARRFFNEARAVNLIEHPSLVQVSDFGQLPDGTGYLVMEFLRGESLSQRLHRGRPSLRSILQISWQTADALCAAHDKGVIHRDLKPANVMLIPEPVAPGGERVKLLDFGVAKLTAGSGKETTSSVVLGTPLYMSPEKRTPQPCERRAAPGRPPGTDWGLRGADLQQGSGRRRYSRMRALVSWGALRCGQCPVACILTSVLHDRLRCMYSPTSSGATTS